MSITRINKFRAQDEKISQLKNLLESMVPLIRSTEGCLSCRLLQNKDDPAEIVVLEEWDTIEAHKASVQHIPKDALQEAMQLLAGPPAGSYYS